jgi:hypothetical protein
VARTGFGLPPATAAAPKRSFGVDVSALPASALREMRSRYIGAR